EKTVKHCDRSDGLFRGRLPEACDACRGIPRRFARYGSDNSSDSQLQEISKSDQVPASDQNAGLTIATGLVAAFIPPLASDASADGTAIQAATPSIKISGCISGMLTTFRTLDCVRKLRGEACVALVDMPGQSRSDLLQYPAIAVRIAERGERRVAFSLRI